MAQRSEQSAPPTFDALTPSPDVLRRHVSLGKLIFKSTSGVTWRCPYPRHNLDEQTLQKGRLDSMLYPPPF
jgi:hypothetical protein